MNYISNIFGLGMGTLVSSVISKKYLLNKVENINDTILNDFPKTTLLLPTLNEEWMIEKTLQSIKNQNIYKLYPDKFEIILIDSSSEDNTVNIARNYVDKIITLSERNLILARTIGIDYSEGDIIVFIDADTLYPVNWLNTMLKHYNNSNVIAVSGPELHSEYNIVRNIFEPILTSFSIKKNNEMIGHNSSCYKWAFYVVNGFDVSFEYDIKSSRDTQIVLEINFAKKLKEIGNYVYDKRLIVYDYGLKRRNLFNRKKELCNNDLIKENKYLCNYWNEREKGIRF